jgi:acyl carrier protein
MSVIDEDVKRVILDFIAQHNPIPGDTESEQLAVAYLDEGLLDSMAIVELVLTLEESFEIRLEPEEMQSEEFRTIGGLIDVVSRLRVP